MIGMTIKAAKGGFFDRKKVINATDKATRRVLSKFGAYVRQRARSSIRTRRRISRPGEPPSSHTGILKRFIFFAFDAGRKSVVIGPAKTNQQSDAPEVLEYGGDVVRNIDGDAVEMTYRPRPYMGPAFEAEKPQLPSLWKNSVR